MKIIFRADDLGFSEAVNYGIRKAIVDGVITCTGLMPNMPYAASGYALVKDTGVEVGQHTNICVGRPLTDSARIPSLVQPSGEFCTSREIRDRKQDTIVLEEVELEIQAQLDRFRDHIIRDVQRQQCFLHRSAAVADQKAGVIEVHLIPYRRDLV